MRKDGGLEERKGWIIEGEADGKWVYLGYLKGDRTFPRVYYCKEGKTGETERISRCKSSLQMSKYAVNHPEDLRVLKCFLTESVSQAGGSRTTKTLTGVAAEPHPSPTNACTIPGLCKHKAKPKWPPFRRCPNARFVWNQENSWLENSPVHKLSI